MNSIPLVESVHDSRNSLTIGAVVLLIGLGYVTIKSRRLPLLIGLSLITLPFLPASNLCVTVGFVLAERVLYIPSMGLILIVVFGLQLLSDLLLNYRKSIYFLLLLTCLSGSTKTILRNCDWTNRQSLLRSGLRTLPDNAKMHYNYANYLKDCSRIEDSIFHYHEALRLWPNYASAYNNLGTLMSSFDAAEKHFLSAIRIASGHHLNAHYNLGVLYRKANRSQHSELMLRNCLRIEPNFVPALLELTKLTTLTAKQSIAIFAKILRLKPRHIDYWVQYGHWLKAKRCTVLAIAVYKQALTIDSRHRNTLVGLSRSLRERGQYGRFLLLITRWQLLQNQLDFTFAILPKYDQIWQIKSELLIKAKAYDSATFLIEKLYKTNRLMIGTEPTKCRCAATKRVSNGNRTSCDNFCRKLTTDTTVNQIMMANFIEAGV